MDNHERALATHEALQKRKIRREKEKDREADNATAVLVRAKTRGKWNSITNSTRKAGRY